MHEELVTFLNCSFRQRIEDILVGIYVVDLDGSFIVCNREVKRILGYSGEDLPKSIDSYYYDPTSRIELINRLKKQEAQGKYLKRQTLRLRRRNKECFAYDFCRSIRSVETSEIIGFIGCLVDITEEERTRLLSDRLKSGAYRLNQANTIVFANQALHDLLGYARGELIGRKVADLYSDPKDAEFFGNLIREKGQVLDYIVELANKDGETKYFSTTSYTLREGNEYIGREGILHDVNKQYQYLRILDQIDVGLYIVDRKDDSEPIVDCNEWFARLLGFESINDILGTDIQGFYCSPDDHRRLLQELESEEVKKDTVIGYELEIRTKLNEKKTIEVHCTNRRNKNGKLIGRAGLVNDITSKKQLEDRERILRDKVHEFTYDFGRVLHSYQSTLIRVKNSIKHALNRLGPDTLVSNQRIEQDSITPLFLKSWQHLHGNMNKILREYDSEDNRLEISNKDLNNLRAYLSTMYEMIDDSSETEFSPAVFRYNSEHILRILKSFEVPDELRDSKNQCEIACIELARLGTIVSLHSAQEAVLEMGIQVKALREYVTEDTRIAERKSVRSVSALIRQATFDLDEFAAQREIKVRIYNDNDDAVVYVAQRDMERAIGNVIHNAIKYSWFRRNTARSWIGIRVTKSNKDIKIVVSNFGVPIPRDEINTNLVFSLGFRGKFSSDRGRLGTGIGLSDTRRVVIAHGGNIAIESYPASGKDEKPDFDKPFRTNVTITLPIHHEES